MGCYTKSKHLEQITKYKTVQISHELEHINNFILFKPFQMSICLIVKFRCKANSKILKNKIDSFHCNETDYY